MIQYSNSDIQHHGPVTTMGDPAVNLELWTQIHDILINYTGKLEALGTKDAIALHFQGRGLQAFCTDSQKCAIAEDFTRVLLENGIEFSNVAVEGSLQVNVRGAFTVLHELPPPAQDFVEGFDEGQYGELVHPDDAEGQILVLNHRVEQIQNEVEL